MALMLWYSLYILFDILRSYRDYSSKYNIYMKNIPSIFGDV